MGDLFTNEKKITNDSNLLESQAEIPVKLQMKHIVQHWIRKQKCIGFPHDIIDLIINTYTFQSVFDLEYMKKLKDKSKPKPLFAPPVNSTTTDSVIRSVRSYDYLFKLLLIGDVGVGKSCLLHRFAGDSFGDTFITNIGIDFKIKTINVENKTFKLQIWDTAGQERFGTISNAYYRGAHGVLMVYDVQYRSTLDDITRWNTEIDKYSNDNIQKLLVGNKIDLNNNVSFDEALKLCNQLNINTCIQTSAKTGENVDLIFETLAKQMYQCTDTFKMRKLMPFYG